MTDHIRVKQFEDHGRVEPGLIRFYDKLIESDPMTKEGTNKWGFSSGGKIVQQYDINNEWRCPELDEIKAFFKTWLPDPDFELFAWFTVLTSGGLMGVHDHTAWGGEYTGIYHVTGDGDLVIVEAPHQSKQIIGFRPGQLIVIPSTCLHEIPECLSTKRMSISIDARRAQRVEHAA